MPALAQQGSECRGKANFDLGNGLTGCILEIRESAIVSSVSIDRRESSSRESVAARASFAMYGPFPKAYPAVSRTMMNVCRTTLGAIQKQMGGTKYESITLIASWPQERTSFQQPGRPATNPPVVSGFANKRCRAFRFFGTRSR
jgi:hypothetical protein